MHLLDYYLALSAQEEFKAKHLSFISLSRQTDGCEVNTERLKVLSILDVLQHQPGTGTFRLNLCLKMC